MTMKSGWRQTARGQGGVVAQGQLVRHGVSYADVHRMSRTGGLERLCRGVYLVGGAPLTFHAQLWSAVLATRGALGFGTAAELWGISDIRAMKVHVIVPHQRRIAIPFGVRVHRVPLPGNARRDVDGLPVSARPWTVLDYLATLRGSDASALFDRSLQQGWLQPMDVQVRLTDWRGRTGNRQLRRLATTLGDNAAAESERRLHRILRQAGVVGWRANYRVWAAGDLVGVIDVAIPEQKLAIEVDGMAHHIDVTRFRRDRTKQNRLVLLGWTVLRFTWADLAERPEYVAAAVRQAAAA